MNMYESAMIILPIAITVLIFLTSILSLAFYFAKEEEMRMALVQSLGQRFEQIRFGARPETVTLISINQYRRNKKYRELYEQRSIA